MQFAAVVVVLAPKVKSRSVFTIDILTITAAVLTRCNPDNLQCSLHSFLFQRMERGNYAYQSVVKGLSDREANDALNAFVSAWEYCVCVCVCVCVCAVAYKI